MAEFLEVVRAEGGVLLAKDPAEIIMGSAVRELEGPLAPVPCVSETACQKCEECLDET